MRCFIAVDLDSKLQEKVIDIQKYLIGLDTKVVEPENFHFTLKFLGEVDVKTLDEVKTRIQSLTSNITSFNIELEGVGAFPNEHFIRVVWVGADKLTPLQKEVNEVLKGLFTPEKPVSHLTLARVRSQDHRQKIVDFIEKYRNTKIGSMKVDAIKIKKSTVTNKGPVYEDMEVFDLS